VGRAEDLARVFENIVVEAWDAAHQDDIAEGSNMD
jgi:hypothetical protein